MENFGELPCEFTDFSEYYYDSSEIGGLSDQYILIGIEKEIEKSAITEFVQSKQYLDTDYDFKINTTPNYAYKDSAIKLRKSSDCNEITWILDDLKKEPLISYAHFTMNTTNCKNDVDEPIGNKCVDSYSNILYVKLKNLSDTLELKNIATETNSEIKAQDSFMPLWFTLYVDKHANYELFEMIDFYKESGLFEHVDPDIIKLAVD